MLLAAGLVMLWVVLCMRLVLGQRDREQSEPAPGPRLRGSRQRLPRQRRPELPEGHRPPPGLGPLSPSERFLSEEAARGLRDLQTWLADQARA